MTVYLFYDDHNQVTLCNLNNTCDNLGERLCVKCCVLQPLLGTRQAQLIKQYPKISRQSESQVLERRCQRSVIKYTTSSAMEISPPPLSARKDNTPISITIKPILDDQVLVDRRKHNAATVNKINNNSYYGNKRLKANKRQTHLQRAFMHGSPRSFRGQCHLYVGYLDNDKQFGIPPLDEIWW